MRHPSKSKREIHKRLPERAAILAAIQQAARTGGDTATAVAALVEHEEALARLEAEPDVYLCVQCGNEFEDDPDEGVDHLDILTPAVIRFKKGEKPFRLDYGPRDPRRIKFCGNCVSEWAIDVMEYVEKR